MNRDKQIEEIAKLLYLNYDMPYEFSEGLAEFLIDEDYAKASDVAREIIDDLESQILPSGKGLYDFPVITHEFIAELKKKYT